MPKHITTEMFIEKAKAVHSDIYDYSKVHYEDSRIKVCIICSEHGEFWQTPHSHLKGYGCSKCGRKNSAKSHTKSTAMFIAEARAAHGDKYDYSKTEYKHSRLKIRVICPNHGEFSQLPYNHLVGEGCPFCGVNVISEKNTKSTEYFIEKARSVHKDRYDYSKVEYVDSKTNVCIICSEHGEFWQRPNRHLRGSGCPVCGRNSMADKGRLSLSEFVKKASGVHGNTYDYSKVDYKNMQTKVCIICPEHGEFWQTPQGHLNGRGCAECASMKLGSHCRSNTEEFIQKAKQIHGDKYDYSHTEYILSSVKVCIICPKHGEFWQMPSIHLLGSGCPNCRRSIGEETVARILDGYDIVYTPQYFLKYADGSKAFLDFMTSYGAIEFDGEQHFKSGNRFGDNNKFDYTIERDDMKNVYCKENDISLLRIRYDQMNKIESILKHFIENPNFYKTRYNPYLTNEEYYSIREANGGRNETKAS